MPARIRYNHARMRLHTVQVSAAGACLSVTSTFTDMAAHEHRLDSVGAHRGTKMQMTRVGRQKMCIHHLPCNDDSARFLAVDRAIRVRAGVG
jgi:hypothetical protein